MSTGIGSPLALGGLYPSVDGRYVAANGKPFTSVSNAESALNGFPSKLSELCVGYTVLVKESGWTEAKEYWVQPKGTTPETYGLVEKGAGVTDYNDLDNKPTIGDGTNTALPIVGNVKVSAVTASGSTAGVTVTPGQNTGEIEMQFTLPKGDKGEDGADGQDGQDGAPGAPGHNPCLGRFTTLPTLSPNPFEDALAGDYFYYDTTDSQTSEPVTYIYHFDGEDWDSGTVIDAEHPTLASGQTVTSVHIKDENGDDDPNTQGVLSAEAGMELNENLEEIYKEETSDLVETVTFASNNSASITFDTIELAQDGDFIDIKFNNIPQPQQFSFLTYNNGSEVKPAISINNYIVGVAYTTPQGSSTQWITGFNAGNSHFKLNGDNPEGLESPIGSMNANSDGGRVKIMFSNGNIIVQCATAKNGELVTLKTIDNTSHKTISFNGMGAYSEYHWIGEIGEIMVKSGSSQYTKLTDFPSYTVVNGTGLTVTQTGGETTESGKLPALTSRVVTLENKVQTLEEDNETNKGDIDDLKDSCDELEENVVNLYSKELITEGDEIISRSINKGYATFNKVTLSQDGDELEVWIKGTSDDAYIGGGFLSLLTAGDTWQNAIFLNSYKLGLKNASNQWVTGFNAANGEKSISPVSLLLGGKIKISYANSGVTIHVEDKNEHSADYTINSQPTIEFNVFGKGYYASAYRYWITSIDKFKVVTNGNTYNRMSELPGFTLVSEDGEQGLEIKRTDVYKETGLVVTEPLLQQGYLHIKKVDNNNFYIAAIRKDKMELRYKFTKSYFVNTIGNVSDVVTTDVWNNLTITDSDGHEAIQGNTNFIFSTLHNSIGAATGHIGPEHGCEVQKYTKFLADGKEIEVESIPAAGIICKHFQFIQISDCYKVATVGTHDENNIPELDNEGNPVVLAEHYMVWDLWNDNRSTLQNALKLLDDIVFTSINYAMLQVHCEFFDTITTDAFNLITFEPDADADDVVDYTNVIGNIIGWNLQKGYSCVAYGKDMSVTQRMLSSNQDSSTLVLYAPPSYPDRVKVYFKPPYGTNNPYSAGTVLRFLTERVICL